MSEIAAGCCCVIDDGGGPGEDPLVCVCNLCPTAMVGSWTFACVVEGFLATTGPFVGTCTVASSDMVLSKPVGNGCAYTATFQTVTGTVTNSAGNPGGPVNTQLISSTIGAPKCVTALDIPNIVDLCGTPTGWVVLFSTFNSQFGPFAAWPPSAFGNPFGAGFTVEALFPRHDDCWGNDPPAAIRFSIGPLETSDWFPVPFPIEWTSVVSSYVYRVLSLGISLA